MMDISLAADGDLHIITRTPGSDRAAEVRCMTDRRGYVDSSNAFFYCGDRQFA
jgi:hypothetical protein